MKRLSLFLLPFIVVACSSPYWVDRVNIIVANDSDKDIACFFPRASDYPLEGYPYHVYPDTTITFAKNFVQFPFKAKTEKEYKFICYHNFAKVYEHYNTDTLSFFVFDNSIMTGKRSREWNDVAEEYDVLVRYDISLEDMRLLSVSNLSVEISYPPTQKMKDIKMWPPYEKVIKDAESVQP